MPKDPWSDIPRTLLPRSGVLYFNKQKLGDVVRVRLTHADDESKTTDQRLQESMFALESRWHGVSFKKGNGK